LPQPIPLNCESWLGTERNHMAGTGFLVNRGDIVWLVTCVHIVTGQKDTPIAKAPFQLAQLHVVGANVTIPFYLYGQERFSLIPHTPSSTYLDVAAIRLSLTEIQFLKPYGMHALESIVRPHLGEQVSACGFPGLQRALISATSLIASIEQIVGVSALLSKDSSTGLSGAAVTSSSGLIGLVHGNRTSGPVGNGAVVILFHDIVPNLFR